MRARHLAAALGAALLAGIAPGTALAGDPIMPLSQLRPGMQCTGYSVVRGTDDQLVRRRDRRRRRRRRVGRRRPAHPRPRVRPRRSTRTGVGPGFSGSPIYCPTATACSATARSPRRSASTAARPCWRRRSRRSSANPPDAPRGEADRARDRASGACCRSARAADRRRGARAAAIAARLRARAARGDAGPAARCSPRPRCRSAPFPPQPPRPGLGARRRVLQRATSRSARSARSPTSTATACGASATRSRAPGVRSLLLQDAYVYTVISTTRCGRRHRRRPTSSPPPATTSARSPTTRSTRSSGRTGAPAADHPGARSSARTPTPARRDTLAAQRRRRDRRRHADRRLRAVVRRRRSRSPQGASERPAQRARQADRQRVLPDRRARAQAAAALLQPLRLRARAVGPGRRAPTSSPPAAPPTRSSALTEIDDYKPRALHVTEFAAARDAPPRPAPGVPALGRPAAAVRAGRRVRARFHLQVVRGPRDHAHVPHPHPARPEPRPPPADVRRPRRRRPRLRPVRRARSTRSRSATRTRARAPATRARARSRSSRAAIKRIQRYDGVRLRAGGRRHARLPRPAAADLRAHVESRARPLGAKPGTLVPSGGGRLAPWHPSSSSTAARTLWVKIGAHPCWKVQKALDEQGIEYEIVKGPLRRGKRDELEKLSGQRQYPVIEFARRRGLPRRVGRDGRPHRHGRPGPGRRRRLGGGGHAELARDRVERLARSRSRPCRCPRAWRSAAARSPRRRRAGARARRGRGRAANTRCGAVGLARRAPRRVERDGAERADARADLADERVAVERRAARRAISPSSSRPRASRPSRSMMSRFASAAAQHVGWPGVGRRRGGTTARPARSQNGAAIAAADDDAAERQVAARDALGERDHVRAARRQRSIPNHVPRRPKPQITASTTNSTPVRAHSVGDALDVARRRLVHAAGADHRLDEDGRDAVGADALDLGLERLERVVRDLRGVAGRAGPSRRGWRGCRRCSCRSRACRGSPACARSGARARAGRSRRSSGGRAWPRCRSSRRRRGRGRSRASSTGASVGEPLGQLASAGVLANAPKRRVGRERRASARRPRRRSPSRPWPTLTYHRLAVPSR